MLQKCSNFRFVRSTRFLRCSLRGTSRRYLENQLRIRHLRLKKESFQLFLRCRLLVPRRLHLKNRPFPTNRESLAKVINYPIIIPPPNVPVQPFAHPKKTCHESETDKRVDPVRRPANSLNFADRFYRKLSAKGAGKASNRLIYA